MKYKVVYFCSSIILALDNIFQLINLNVILNAIKEETTMHILNFGSLATDLLDFISTILWVAMITMLVKDISHNRIVMCS